MCWKKLRSVFYTSLVGWVKQFFVITHVLRVRRRAHALAAGVSRLLRRGRCGIFTAARRTRRQTNERAHRKFSARRDLVPRLLRWLVRQHVCGLARRGALVEQLGVPRPQQPNLNRYTRTCKLWRRRCCLLYTSPSPRDS